MNFLDFIKKPVVQISAIALVVLAVILAIVLTQCGGKASTETDEGEMLSSVEQLPPETKTVNLLLVGVDFSQELTDVIIYLRFDPKEKTARLLSIPRDTFIGEKVTTGKINSVYGELGGIDALRKQVSERFLLPIDYHIVTTLQTLGDIVDQIGGVTITLEEDLYHENTLFLPEGEQTLNGEQAQMFVRIRHAYVNADLGRIQAQQKFLVALMEKLQSMKKSALTKLLMGKINEVETDLPVSKALSLGLAALNLTKESIEMHTAPGIGKMNYSYAVYEVDIEALCALLNEQFFTKEKKPDDFDFPRVTAPEPTSEPEPETSSEPQKETEDPEEESSSSSSSQPTRTPKPKNEPNAVPPDPERWK